MQMPIYFIFINSVTDPKVFRITEFLNPFWYDILPDYEDGYPA